MAQVLAHYYIFQSLTLTGYGIFAHACQVAETAGWAANADTNTGPYGPQATLVHLRLTTGLFHYERGHFRTGLTVAEAAVDASRTLGVDEDLLLALLL